MDLARAANRFTNSPILAWDSGFADWVDTGVFGALQAFDRFVTERTFGQKKRIMLMGRDSQLDSSYTTVKLQGSEEAFLIEKFNEDVRHGSLYSYIYLLHEAPYFVDVCKATTETNAAGVEIDLGEQVVESVWVDISRFSGAPSRKFEETEFTVNTITFPSDSQVDTDSYLKLANDDRYNVDEIFSGLDLIVARGKRIGL